MDDHAQELEIISEPSTSSIERWFVGCDYNCEYYSYRRVLHYCNLVGFLPSTEFNRSAFQNVDSKLIGRRASYMVNCHDGSVEGSKEGVSEFSQGKLYLRDVRCELDLHGTTELASTY